MLKVRILCIVMGFVGALQAQVNLVPNGSFEEFTNCPNDQGQIKNAKYWYDAWPSGGADYFNNCSNIMSSTQPNNIWGFQAPVSGNSYAGFAVFSESVISQENIMVKLSNVLITNQHYCIELFVSLSNNSSYYVNKLGIYFSNDSILSNTHDFTNFNPQFINTTDLNDSLNWVKISGEYIATGGERFISIGNFNTMQELDTTFIGYPPGINYKLCYYYIDDVSIYECNLYQPNKINIYPNPASEFITVNTGGLQVLEIELFDIEGRKLLQQKTTDTNTTIDVSGFASGIYVCQISSKDRVVKREKVVINK